jgi:hypothetical protein
MLDENRIFTIQKPHNQRPGHASDDGAKQPHAAQNVSEHGELQLPTLRSVDRRRAFPIATELRPPAVSRVRSPGLNV